MTFDWTISLGNLATVAGVVATLLLYKRNQHKDNTARLTQIENTLIRMQQQFNMVWKWFKREHGINGDDDNG